MFCGESRERIERKRHPVDGENGHGHLVGCAGCSMQKNLQKGGRNTYILYVLLEIMFCVRGGGTNRTHIGK